MYWTMNLTLRTRRREWRLEHAIGAPGRPRWGQELFEDGSRRIDLGPLELAIDPRREA